MSGTVVLIDKDNSLQNIMSFKLEFISKHYYYQLMKNLQHITYNIFAFFSYKYKIECDIVSELRIYYI